MPAPFRQIVEALREQIRSGKLKAGDRIPSTRALADQWGVARGTVDRAVRQLRSEGLLDVKQGRAGTVVAEDGGLTELIVAMDGAHVSEVKAVEVIVLDAAQSAAIGEAPGSSLVKLTIRLSR